MAVHVLVRIMHNPGQWQWSMSDSRETKSLIPRQALFGNPDRTMARVSPDGTRISYLAPVKGVLNVWVGPIDDPEAAQPVTHDTKRGIRNYGWAHTNEHIAYAQDKEGDENWHIHSVVLATGEIKDLTPEDGVQARVQEVSHKFADEIILALNDRDPELHDLYRVNLDSGERTLIQHNEGFAGFVTDDDFRVRFAERFEPRRRRSVFSPGWGWRLGRVPEGRIRGCLDDLSCRLRQGGPGALPAR